VLVCVDSVLCFYVCVSARSACLCVCVCVRAVGERICVCVGSVLCLCSSNHRVVCLFEIAVCVCVCV